VRPAVLADDPAAPLVFNAGRIGAGPLMQEIMLRRYLAAGVRPQAVLIEIWPQLFNGCEAEHIQTGQLEFADMGVLRDRQVGRWHMWSGCLAATFAPWADYRYELLHDLIPTWSGGGDRNRRQAHGWTWLNLDERGWLPLNYAGFDGVPRAEIIERMRQQYGPVLHDLHFDLQAEQDYGALLSLCRQHGIKAALLYLPESSEFRAFYGPKTSERFHEIVERLKAEFGVELIDGRFAADDLALPDGHHLTPAGAAHFTCWLESNGLRPWLRAHLPLKDERP
jgi:hypothetical protein